MSIDEHKSSTDKAAKVPGTALLSKALDIIECIANSDGRLRIKDIADQTAYAKPTCYRILAALTSRGFIQVDPRDHAHSLGPRFTEMAGTIAQHSDLISLASIHLKQLLDKYGESVSVGVMAGASLQTIAQSSPAQSIDSVAAIGIRKPLYCTALGKALLVYLDATSRKRVLDKIVFEKLTHQTITDQQSLESELAAIQLRGFALDDEEIVVGARCVAAPILGPQNQTIAAISVSGPTHRMTYSRLNEIAVDIVNAAKAISTSISGNKQTDVSALINLKWLEIDEAINAFKVSSIEEMPDGRLLVCDGPGGSITRVGKETNKIFASNSPIHAACLHNGVLIIACGQTLYRLTPSAPQGTNPVRLFDSEKISKIDTMISIGEKIYVACESTLLEMSTNGEFNTLPVDIIPNSGLKNHQGRPTFVSHDGICQLDPALLTTGLICPTPIEGLRDFAFDPDGSVWLIRHASWAVAHYSMTGKLLKKLPLPVSNPCSLLFADKLYIGSERWSLSSAQLDLAPLSGRLFAVLPENIPAH